MPTPLRILLIDDNPDDRTLIIRELRREFGAVEVEQVGETQELERLLETSQYDLVITDYQLNWTDGLQILQAVLRIRPDCPVVMFTGTGSEEVAAAAMRLGLSDYVIKSPRHYVRLAMAVRSVLEHAEQRRKAKEDERERERMNEEIRQHHERLDALSRRLLEVQEVERQHLARELHDNVAQVLTSLALMLDMAAPLQGEAQQQKLQEARRLLQQLLAGVRELSRGLRPAMLDDLGLLPALLWLTRQVEEASQARVHLRHIGVEDRRFPPALETAVYRIVEEALADTALHAGSADVNVRVWATEGLLGVQIEGHGKGFDQTTLAPGGSGGVIGMAERANLLGGQFTLETTPGDGTCVGVEFPLRAFLEESLPAE
jgi:signal transduction histidine kinase